MRRKLSFVYIPLIYLVIIFGLVLLQFSGGSLFNSRLGPISLSGTFELKGGNKDKQLASITVNAQGLQLIFDKDHPLIVQNMNDSVLELPIRSYSSTQNGFLLGFDFDMQIEVSYTASQPEDIQISVRPANSMLPLKAVMISFIAPKDSLKSNGQTMTGMELRSGANSFALTLPSRAFINTDKKQIVIPGDGNKNLRIAKKQSTSGDIFEDLVKNQVANISAADYSKAIGTYVDASFNGWRSTRYNSGNGTWSFRDSEGRFDEEILVGLLSEAWARNDYARAFNDMRSAADLHQANLTHRSSVFLGSLRRITNELVAQDRVESSRLSDLINQKNPDVFLKPGLFQFAIDRGTGGLSAKVLQFAESLTLSELSPVQALGILQNIYLSELPDDGLYVQLERFNSLIKDKILSNIVGADEGYFFKSTGNRSQSLYSVMAGRVLEKAGERLADERMTNLGKIMVMSIIKLGDSVGYVPAELEFSAGSISSTISYLGPESIYWILNSNPNFPRYVSLNRQLGPGNWFYTIAKVNTINIRPDEYRFNFSYPRSRTHFLFFKSFPNIDAQVGLQLFGRVWRNAGDFEVYSKGRFYNPETRTLMIKYFDDSVQGDLVILYR